MTQAIMLAQDLKSVLLRLYVAIFVATFGLLLPVTSVAHKVKVGYDKMADFSKYKTYTWMNSTSPAARPLLAMTVFGMVDEQLGSKGLQSVDQNGDLLIRYAGGVDVSMHQSSGTPIYPSYSGDAGMWTGAYGASSVLPYVQEGTLMMNL